MAQSWERLAFLHWPVDAGVLAEVLPPGIEPDQFEGSAWIGVTPFQARRTRLRFTLPIPIVSSFPEINLRTYVTHAGKPGIWFMSLETSNWPAVHAARKAYRLPYHHASQELRVDGECVEFGSRRDEASFAARYCPVGPVRRAEPGTFEYFMAERYCLYTLNERRDLLRADIEHQPWPLQPAECEISTNTMAYPYGIELTGEPRTHYADRVDVVFWTLTR
jgi:uncharacterized protein YqjF (DUF2071 family)